jgi:hypothetical protein
MLSPHISNKDRLEAVLTVYCCCTVFFISHQWPFRKAAMVMRKNKCKLMYMIDRYEVLGYENKAFLEKNDSCSACLFALSMYLLAWERSCFKKNIKGRVWHVPLFIVVAVVRFVGDLLNFDSCLFPKLLPKDCNESEWHTSSSWQLYHLERSLIL